MAVHTMRSAIRSLLPLGLGSIACSPTSARSPDAEVPAPSSITVSGSQVDLAAHAWCDRSDTPERPLIVRATLTGSDSVVLGTVRLDSIRVQYRDRDWGTAVRLGSEVPAESRDARAFQVEGGPTCAQDDEGAVVTAVMRSGAGDRLLASARITVAGIR